MKSDDDSVDLRAASAIVAGGKLRSTLLELWQRTRIDWGFVTDRLSATFRKEKWIGGHERRFIGETLYGMIRNLRRIDFAVAIASGKNSPPRDLDRLLAYLLLTNQISATQASAASGGLQWSKVGSVDDKIASERNAVTRLALQASLPDWLAKMLFSDWSDEAFDLAKGLNQRAPMTVRANTLVTSRQKLQADLAEENLTASGGSWCDTALQIRSRANLLATKSFAAGAMEAQDEASQLLADLAVPRSSSGTMQPGLVVDLCAGAGGKSLAIAARMQNKGRIVATDVDGNKLEELRRRARRANITILHAATVEDSAWPDALESTRGKADVVLVDAPCSGVGALRRNPEARFRLQPQDFVDFARRQSAILDRAVMLCAPGGKLIYATCTLTSIENQQVVQALLARNPKLERVPLTSHAPEISATFDRDGAFTSLPHRHDTDGFFAQVLRLKP